jgi:hypothetical protein
MFLTLLLAKIIMLLGYSQVRGYSQYKACLPLGEFARANREKGTLTTSPTNHIRFLLVRAQSGKRA